MDKRTLTQLREELYEAAMEMAQNIVASWCIAFAPSTRKKGIETWRQLMTGELLSPEPEGDRKMAPADFIDLAIMSAEMGDTKAVEALKLVKADWTIGPPMPEALRKWEYRRPPYRPKTTIWRNKMLAMIVFMVDQQMQSTTTKLICELQAAGYDFSPSELRLSIYRNVATDKKKGTICDAVAWGWNWTWKNVPGDRTPETAHVDPGTVVAAYNQYRPDRRTARGQARIRNRPRRT